jgi:hypothetical protein
MMTAFREGEGPAIAGNRRTPGPEADSGKREVSLTAVDLAEVRGMPDGPVPAGESFLHPLVAQCGAELGRSSQPSRAPAVQAFVPVPVDPGRAVALASVPALVTAVVTTTAGASVSASSPTCAPSRP